MYMKGVPFLGKVYERGTFSVKYGIWRGGGGGGKSLALGAELPRIKLCWVPPGIANILSTVQYSTVHTQYSNATTSAVARNGKLFPCAFLGLSMGANVNNAISKYVSGKI